MRRVAAMRTIMESILNAEQLARFALHPAELHAALQVDYGTLDHPLKLHHTCMAALETRQV